MEIKKRRRSITLGRYLNALRSGAWMGVEDLEKILFRHPHTITKFFRTNEEIKSLVETEQRKVGKTRRIYWRLKK